MKKIHRISDDELLAFWRDQPIVGSEGHGKTGHEISDWHKAEFGRIALPNRGEHGNYRVSVFGGRLGRHEFHIVSDSDNIRALCELDSFIEESEPFVPIVGYGRWGGYGLPSCDYVALVSRDNRDVIYEDVFRNEHSPAKEK
jgi:hypothetical protein